MILADYATGRADRNLEMGRAVCHGQSGWLLPAVSGGGGRAVQEGVDAGAETIAA